MKHDTEVYEGVLAELAWDPRVDQKEIGVVSTDGIVTLTGFVSTYAEKTAAERAAERVSGVRAVANDLAVRVPAALVRSDTEIAQAVVDALEWDVRGPARRLQSAVTNGWVTLTGDVEWRYERDAAAQTIVNLAGVRGVTNEIKVAARHVSADEVAQNIQDALERRADRTAHHVTVETVGTVVTLKGNVPSFGDRRAVNGAAWAAPGVTEVRDELAVVL
jgi:osmotically-inducible protein OsmY